MSMEILSRSTFSVNHPPDLIMKRVRHSKTKRSAGWVLALGVLTWFLVSSTPARSQEGYVVRTDGRLLFIDTAGNGQPTVGNTLRLLATNGSEEQAMGIARIVSGSGRFVRAEVVEFAPGVTEGTLVSAARAGDLRVAVSGTAATDGQANDDPTEPMLQSAFGSMEGRVRQVVDQLVYVEGMKDSVPLWSTLSAASGNAQGESFEVIKELGDLLVAHNVSPTGSHPQQEDRLIGVARGDGNPRRSRRTVYATRVDEGPDLDGRLDDPVWGQARPIRGFVQREPDYWMPGTDPTEARVLYDEDNLYIGFECASETPERIVANNMRRDEILSGDDHISVLLDTYNDRQNGFFFFVNPHGTQRDLLLSNEGRTSNDSWDANWKSKTHRHEGGWSVEMQIPFDQLRFKEGATTWGLNLGRGVSAKNEEVALVVGTQSSSGRARYWTSDIAELRGMEGVRSKRLLQIKPYILPSSSRDRLAIDPEQKQTFESGADLRYGITSNLTLDLSYNTDFAQVEGDQEQVNLTQFSLFFPEKREFFLEGANVFSFGEAAVTRGSDARPPTLLFNSRRIGLEDKRLVPIVLGSKIAGKVGRTSLGVMNALTDNTTFQDVDGQITVPRSNFSVVRMRQDLLARSNVGFIFVNKQTSIPDSGWDSYNRAGGLDFSYSPTRSLNFKGFAARTWDSELNPGNAFWARADYRGSLADWRAIFLDVDDFFEPEVGFVNRRGDLDGFRRYESRYGIEPRIRTWGIYSARFRLGSKIFTDRQNDLKNAETTFEISLENFQSDDFDLEVVWERDEVVEPFEPSDRRPDVVIPAGTYDFVSTKAGVRTSRNRKLQGQVDFEAGSFYTGDKYTLTVRSAIKPSGRFNVETEYETNWLRMPEGNVNVQLVNARLIYSFTTDFFVKLFTQWNNEDELASFNFLVNYRYRPGSDIFLVYDQAFGTIGGFEERNRALLLKLSYLLGI